jgi:transcription elongation factor GreA
MEARIRQIKALLDEATVVDRPAGDRIAVGSVVNLRYEGDSDIETFFVGSIEERRPGLTVVSPSSPLGAALLGAQVGDSVSYDSPGGRLTVEIVSLGDSIA